jgi:O-antigen ligase
MTPPPLGGASDGSSSGGAVGPGLAVVFATTAFVTLVIFGWGMLSLVLGEDVIETRGLGPVPGVVATVVSLVAFALSLLGVVRQPHPSFWNAAWVSISAAFAAIVGAGLGGVFSGAGLGVAMGVSIRFATSWVGIVVIAAGAICAWGGIALVRTRSRRPQWPWEEDET